MELCWCFCLLLCQCEQALQNGWKTRMHSSRMRTACTMTGRAYHACPPSPFTMHAPFAMHTPLCHTHPPLPCMPPFATHAPLHHTCPPREQPCMPPQEQPCTPPGSNHACPLGATMHPPEQPHTHPWEQPHTPPRAIACPPATTHTPCGQTDTCKNITFANFVCGR